MKSVKLISLGIAMLMSFVALAQDKTVISINRDNKPIMNKKIRVFKTVCNPTTYNPKKSSALIVVDGKIRRRKFIKKIVPDKVKHIEILKDSAAIRKYGKAGKNGVILISTR